MLSVRLSKYLSHQGFGTRSEADNLIRQGKVMVNGALVTDKNIKINPEVATITVDGQPVISQPAFVYYWLNKPVGVISSHTSHQGEKRVIDFVPSSYPVNPVGRLDKDSRGLMLLTNDGLLAHRLMHPKYHIAKTYEVTVDRLPTTSHLRELRDGLELDGERTLPSFWEILSSTKLRCVLHQGKNRQIRRMLDYFQIRVLDLVRTSFGPFPLGDLKAGDFKPVTAAELQQLFQATSTVNR